MKIKNLEELAVSDARRSVLNIAEAGLEAIDTENVLRGMIRIDGDTLRLGNTNIELAAIEKIVFVAIGKCASEATTVAAAALGDHITRGVMIDVKTCPFTIPQIKAFCGTHPLPSEENMNAATAILETLTGLTEKDLVIFVISGGGSTLLFLPEDHRDRNEIAIFKALTAAGADIREMNVVRKHMSLARGGFLAKAAYPARVVSLIFSDVIGDDLSAIASGPTVKDTTTAEDAEKILAKYEILQTCSIEKCGMIETPKEDKYFERTTNILAVSNIFALDAMRAAAEKLGYHAEVRSAALEGEAEKVAQRLLEELHAAAPRSVLLWGGETTVTVRKPGNGGRNITICAAALESIKDGEELLSLASDGRDHGPYAGALCDTITKKAAADAGVDIKKYLEDNETYPLFEKIGNYLMTGDTGSNVSDLIIALKE